MSDNRYGTEEAVKKIGISFERLRYWERKGIVHPVYVTCGVRKFRRYSKEDIKRAQFVRILVDEENYSLEGAHRLLEQKENLLDIV